jgi:serine protease Do
VETVLKNRRPKTSSIIAWITASLLAITWIVESNRSGPAQAVAAEPQTKTIGSLRDLNNAFIDIAKTVTPSVVTVSTERTLTLRGVSGFPFTMDPFGDFFGNQGGRSPQRQYKQSGLGSGVIVSQDGYIMTNNHVVADADSIRVRLFDGRKLPARVIGRDERTDIAVIKVDANNLDAIKRGNSDDLQVGEMVMAIGSPLSENLAHTVTQGIVSAKGRQNVGLATYEDFIQTDAAINPGNSGGALVNLDGELVGVNSAIASQSGGFQGIGFAIPSNMAFNIMDMLISKGKVTRGWLGILPQDIDEKMGAALKLKENQGVLIGDVTADSPAEKAGLQSGDVITAIDKEPMANASKLRTQIAQAMPGTKIKVTLLRDGKSQDIDVQLGELPAELASSNGADKQELLGFTVTALTRDLANQYGIDPRTQGVVISAVDQNSSAGQAGLQEGDVVRSFNRLRTPTVADFNRATSNLKKGDQILMQIERSGNRFFVPFTL